MIVVVNGKKRTVDVDPETPLLWVLREQLRLIGRYIRSLPLTPEKVLAAQKLLTVNT